MFETYILPILIFAFLGIAAGVLLTMASRIFAVKIDPRTEMVNEALPQINCGACGYSGCGDYAKAVTECGEAVNLCKPGGKNSAEKIAKIMGVGVETPEKKYAFVHCSGSCNAQKNLFKYDGEQTCRSAVRYYGGMRSCKYGCIGLGDCASVCPSGAIEINDLLAEVIAEKCIGCGLCVKACPNSIIELRTGRKKADVLCFSKEPGKIVRQICSKGCIGCKICEKQCEYDAIHVKENLASVDYEKCTACGECIKKCPVSVIELRR